MEHATRKKAEELLRLHHTGKLLVLPNIWDVIGVKLLMKLKFDAIATASASIAFARGYPDGEYIPFAEVLSALKSIAASTSLPVTADLERGYASDNALLVENIKAVIACGIVGINFEDSVGHEGALQPIDQQCERIRVIRKTADQAGVPLVINARTDVFLNRNVEGDKTAEAILRGKAYRDAGADCFYPIACSMTALKAIREQLPMPINVLALKSLLPMKELEAMGIARLSFGPLFLKLALTRMMESATAAKAYKLEEVFTENLLSSDDVASMVSSLQ